MYTFISRSGYGKDNYKTNLMENNNKNNDLFSEGSYEEEELDTSPSTLNRAFTVIIALLALVGLLSISGIREIVFYWETPKEATQEEIPPQVGEEDIILPINVIITRGAEEYASSRSEEEARDLVQDTSSIWNQANIRLEVENILFSNLTEEEFETFYREPRQIIANLEGYNSESINVLLTAHLKGINGVSFGGARTVAVADKTTVLDFRVLAHEIGHQLGLGHVTTSKGRLMYKGANGTALSSEEIEEAREAVLLRSFGD